MSTTHLFWYLARAAGFLAFTFAWSSVVWGLLMSTRYLPHADRATLYILHRLLGFGSLILLAVHLYALYLDPWAKFSVKDLSVPFAATYRPFWLSCGIASAALLIVLTVSSLLMPRLPVVVWRGIHYLSFLTFALGLAHGIGTGTDSPRLWARVWYAIAGASVAGLCANRLIWGRQATRRVRGPIAARQIDPRSHALRGLQAAIESGPYQQQVGAPRVTPSRTANHRNSRGSRMEAGDEGQWDQSVPRRRSMKIEAESATVAQRNHAATCTEPMPRVARRRGK